MQKNKQYHVKVLLERFIWMVIPKDFIPSLKKLELHVPYIGE